MQTFDRPVPATARPTAQGGTLDLSRIISRIIRDFLAALLKAPTVPLEVGAVAPRRYQRSRYPEPVARRIGPAVARLAAASIIRAFGSHDGAIGAAVSRRSARRMGLVALWVLADAKRARALVKALNKLLSDKPQPGLFD